MSKRLNVSVEYDETDGRLEGFLNLDSTAKSISWNGLRKFFYAAPANLLKIAYQTASSKPVTVTTGGSAATATVTFTGQPNADEVICINGTNFTAKASGATGNQFNIGGTTTITATNLAAAINNSATANVSKLVTATSAANVVTITSILGGIVSNFLTVSKTSVASSVAATAVLTLTGLPTATQTVVVNGVTFTARASGAVANEFNIGADETETATNIAASINASVTAKIVGVVTATSALGVVTITAVTPGAGGNLYTSTETLDNATFAGATFSGGTQTAGLANTTVVNFTGGAISTQTRF